MSFFKSLTILISLFFYQTVPARGSDLDDTEKLLREAEAMIESTDQILEKPDTYVQLDNSLTLPVIIFSITLFLSIAYYIYLWKTGKKTKPDSNTETSQ